MTTDLMVSGGLYLLGAWCTAVAARWYDDCIDGFSAGVMAVFWPLVWFGFSTYVAADLLKKVWK